MPNQNAEFYVACDGPEYVWHGNNYAVIRNGEMRIHYKGDVISYTDDLIRAGITLDEQLEVLYAMDAVIHNPWFEIENRDSEWDPYPEIYSTLGEAIAVAKVMEEN
jgi:hypothetical protein